MPDAERELHEKEGGGDIRDVAGGQSLQKK